MAKKRGTSLGTSLMDVPLCLSFSSSGISQFTNSDWKYIFFHLELLDFFPSFLIFFHTILENLSFAGCHGTECCKDILKFLLKNAKN